MNFQITMFLSSKKEWFLTVVLTDVIKVWSETLPIWEAHRQKKIPFHSTTITISL